MAKMKPIHSDEPGRKVYHDNDGCTEANNIEKRHLEHGTGDKRICKHCKKLDRGKK